MTRGAESSLERPRARGLIRRIALVLVLITLGGAVLASGFPLCPTASLFGIPCPSCGLTRASLALLRGDLHSAMHFHPLAPLLLPLIALLVGDAVVRYVTASTRRGLLNWSHRATGIAALCLLALLLGTWLARFSGALGGPVSVTRLL